MPERKPFIFAPGFKQTYYVQNYSHRGSYDPVMRLIEKAGFEALFYQPDWRSPNPRVWVTGMAALAISAANKSGQGVILGGFSGGGLTAVLAANELEQTSDIQVDGLVGCSVSPWVGSDYVHRAHLFPTDLRGASEELKDEFSKLQLPKIECMAQLYVGSREMPTLHEMRDDALSLWPNAEAITTPCGHNIFHDAYLQAVSHNVGRLAITESVL